MHLLTLSLALASTALAADMTLMEVLAAENATLSTLNSLLAAQPALVSTISGITSGITILAPSNAAFNNFLSIPGNKDAAADPGTVAAILEYHVLNGTFPSSFFTTMNQFIPSLLTNESFTNVTGGQVVNGVLQDGKVVLRSGLKEASTVQTANLMFIGGVLHIIDTVLTLPLNPSFSALDSNLTALAGALQDTTLINAVNNLKDVTIFAPSNAAFQAIGSATGGLSTQQLAGILEYHIINGTVGYSPLLTTGLANETFPTLQGGDVAVSVEDGKVFVNSAQVIITDIIVSNGVMHVLDK
jgi:transforming growth factor-beta-induced protein